MAHPNEDALRTATEAINSGDMETFLALHSPDVVLHVVGHNPGAGDFHGREGVAQAFQSIGAILDGPPQFDLHDVLANDEHGVILGTQTFIRGGKTFASESTVVLNFKDGLATEVWVNSNDPYAEDAFLS